MFNVGGGELLVIFLVALIVLGPAKLPEVARQIGGVMREVRRISSGFQDEMRAAMDDPIEDAARERGNRVVTSSEAPAPDSGPGDRLDDEDGPEYPDDDLEGDEHGEGADEVTPGPAPTSTAAAAGMYDLAPSTPTSTPNPYRAPVGTRAEPVPADGDGPGEGDAEATSSDAEPAESAGDTTKSDEVGDPDVDESSDRATDEH